MQLLALHNNNVDTVNRILGGMVRASINDDDFSLGKDAGKWMSSAVQPFTESLVDKWMDSTEQREAKANHATELEDIRKEAKKDAQSDNMPVNAGGTAEAD